MGKVQKISVALPKTMTDMVNRAVKSGQYASASEVVREALRDWSQYEKAKAEALATMRAQIQDGINSGPGEEWDVGKLKAELHAEFALKTKLRKSA
jgi:antitoxin ParD1/3/4